MLDLFFIAFRRPQESLSSASGSRAAASHIDNMLFSGVSKEFFGCAIVVGRKPGSYSFPSGHSAAAFAGATLLQSCYPRGRRLFFAIALLVAFSRIYLGAHYPGDVVSGGLAGTALAKLYQSLFKNLRWHSKDDSARPTGAGFV